MATAVSLFTGCGGSDKGLYDAGFNVIMANDVLQYGQDVYLANWPDTDYVVGDITAIRSFPYADLLAGCYPCQGFSQGGVRDPSRKINYLYREFDRALRQIRPKAFVVENVGGMRYSQNRQILNNQITRFRMAGYRVNWSELDAKDYGVPQDRKRIFIVGIRSDLGPAFEFPKSTHGSEGPLPHVTLADTIGHLPAWPDGEFSTDPFHWYYLSRNRRREWSEPSKTIVSHHRHTPLHPSSPPLKKIRTDAWQFATDDPARRLSYRETALIQGFPTSMHLPDTYGMQAKYRVIGNAVPPPLFRSIAEALPDIW